MTNEAKSAEVPPTDPPAQPGTVEPLTAGEVLLLSGLAVSKSDCLRGIKQKAFKINQETVESMEEEVDFRMFFLCCGQAGVDLHLAEKLPLTDHRLLFIGRGKQRKIVRIDPDRTIKLIAG